MTEKEAWLQIAEAFEAPFDPDSRIPTMNGLCYAAYNTLGPHKEMLNRIESWRIDNDYTKESHFWPISFYLSKDPKAKELDSKYRTKRAALARQFAAEC